MSKMVQGSSHFGAGRVQDTQVSPVGQRDAIGEYAALKSIQLYILVENIEVCGHRLKSNNCRSVAYCRIETIDAYVGTYIPEDCSRHGSIEPQNCINFFRQ